MCKRVYLHGPVRAWLMILYAVGFKPRLNKNEQYETINNGGPVVVDVPVRYSNLTDRRAKIDGRHGRTTLLSTMTDGPDSDGVWTRPQPR